MFSSGNHVTWPTFFSWRNKQRPNNSSRSCYYCQTTFLWMFIRYYALYCAKYILPWNSRTIYLTGLYYYQLIRTYIIWYIASIINSRLGNSIYEIQCCSRYFNCEHVYSFYQRLMFQGFSILAPNFCCRHILNIF